MRRDKRAEERDLIQRLNFVLLRLQLMDLASQLKESERKNFISGKHLIAAIAVNGIGNHETRALNWPIVTPAACLLILCFPRFGCRDFSLSL